MLMENSILLLVISILFKVFKPKKRNFWYGYRTRLSKLSQSNWDEAQKYSSTIFIIVSSVLFVLGILFSGYDYFDIRWTNKHIYFYRETLDK